MAGKVEVTVRILVYWALAKKNERKTIKNSIFFVFDHFLLPKTKVEYNLSYFQIKNRWIPLRFTTRVKRSQFVDLHQAL